MGTPKRPGSLGLASPWVSGGPNWIQEFRWETQLSEARAEYLISAFSFFNVLLLCKSKDLWLELGDDTKA